MLPTFRPDINAWSFWTHRGWIGEWSTQAEAIGARILGLCEREPPCGGMFGAHMPWCKP